MASLGLEIEMSEKQSKGIKGGKRQGAGRKAGVPNKRTAKVQAAVEASGVTPLEFMLQIMRKEPSYGPDADIRMVVANETLRFEAAKAAAPYVHAKLASVELKGSMRLTKTDLSDDDLAAIATASGR